MQEAQRKQEADSVAQEVPHTEEEDVMDEDVLAVTESEDQRSDLRGQISVTDSSTRKHKILPKTKEKLVLVPETEPEFVTLQEKHEAEKSEEIFVLKMESEETSDETFVKTQRQSQIEDVQFVPSQTETKTFIRAETRKQAEISQEKQIGTKTTSAEPKPVQTKPPLTTDELKASVRPETKVQQPEIPSEESVTDIESRRLVKVQQKSEAQRLRTEDLKPSDSEPKEEISAGRGIRISVRTQQGFT